jgi:hypothetical protein
LQKIGQGEKIQVIEGKEETGKGRQEEKRKYSEKKRDTVKAA